MDNFLSEDRYLPFIKSNFLPLLLGIGGLIFLGYGLMSWSGQKQDKKDILFEAAHDESGQVKNNVSHDKKEKITVDVEGAVVKPGVYSLDTDARVQDALIVAGGIEAK
jgi:competence protein ComEA